MKNHHVIQAATPAAPAGREASAPAPAKPRLLKHSTRRAASAAGAAMAGSAVGLAFFLARKPNGFTHRHHAKFRA